MEKRIILFSTLKCKINLLICTFLNFQIMYYFLLDFASHKQKKMNYVPKIFHQNSASRLLQQSQIKSRG